LTCRPTRPVTISRCVFAFWLALKIFTGRNGNLLDEAKHFVAFRLEGSLGPRGQFIPFIPTGAQLPQNFCVTAEKKGGLLKNLLWTQFRNLKLLLGKLRLAKI
jgi:hypothetical protein